MTPRQQIIENAADYMNSKGWKNAAHALAKYFESYQPSEAEREYYRNKDMATYWEMVRAIEKLQR